ncbi:hypothetical protein J6590_104274 [Homalodisca vitripennis]|nr:hypothetical protein J6590_104274 [Homalodisca vitripennis]
MAERQLTVTHVLADHHHRNTEDLDLQRMIDVIDVKQHRPRKNDGTAVLKVKSFKYHVLLRDLKVEVCREAFFRLYDVTDKRIKRLRKLLLIGESPRDKRGKHPCVNKVGPDELLNIHTHISSFPVKTSHYGTREFKYI